MGNRIRELREQRARVAPTAYRVSELACRLRVGETTLRYWERGQTTPTARHARALAKELGVTVGELRLEGAPALKPLAAGVIVRDGKVLLTQRRFHPHGERWSFPSGKIEAGESLEEALVRELHEELLIAPAQVRVVGHLGDTDLPSGFRMSHSLVVIPPDSDPILNDYEQLVRTWWATREEAEEAFATLPEDIAQRALAIIDQALGQVAPASSTIGKVASEPASRSIGKSPREQPR